MTINILGTEYAIEIHKFEDDNTLTENSWAGYCCSDKPLIVIGDMDNKKYVSFSDEAEKDSYFKSCLRHEIIHAFLNESGLKDNSLRSIGAWSKNEEMVDWLACQFPKILKVFQELKCL